MHFALGDDRGQQDMQCDREPPSFLGCQKIISKHVFGLPQFDTNNLCCIKKTLPVEGIIFAEYLTLSRGGGRRVAEGGKRCGMARSACTERGLSRCSIQWYCARDTAHGVPLSAYAADRPHVSRHWVTCLRRQPGSNVTASLLHLLAKFAIVW